MMLSYVLNVALDISPAMPSGAASRSPLKGLSRCRSAAWTNRSRVIGLSVVPRDVVYRREAGVAILRAGLYTLPLHGDLGRKLLRSTWVVGWPTPYSRGGRIHRVVRLHGHPLHRNELPVVPAVCATLPKLTPIVAMPPLHPRTSVRLTRQRGEGS